MSLASVLIGSGAFQQRPSEEWLNDELAKWTSLIASEIPRLKFEIAAALSEGEGRAAARNFAKKIPLIGHIIDLANFEDNVAAAYREGGVDIAVRQAFIEAVDFGISLVLSGVSFGIAGIFYEFKLSDGVREKAGAFFDNNIQPIIPESEEVIEFAATELIGLVLRDVQELSIGEIKAAISNGSIDHPEIPQIQLDDEEIQASQDSVSKLLNNSSLNLPDEINSSPDTAIQIGSGAISQLAFANGIINSQSDSDWFYTELVAGQKYAFILSANNLSDSKLDPFLKILLPSGLFETNDDISDATFTSFVAFVAPETGNYLIEASSIGSTVGGYTLTVTPIDHDRTAGNLTEGTADTDSGNTSGWHWQGDSDDDRPSSLTLEQGGAPDVEDDNKYRGHDGDDRIYADRGDDVIWGDDDEDRLYGEDGDDTLRGGRHDDSLYGGDDDDIIYGEDGDDRIYGDGTTSSSDNGDDTIYGGDGNDDIRGGPDDDYIKGEDDNDELRGNEGNDTLFGDRGDDELDGDEGNDWLNGGRGNDDVEGDDGHDRLAGEDGNDTLEGGEGDDEIYGGDDNDTLQGGQGNDLLHGEDGNDTADFSDGDAGVTINLFDEIAVSTELGSDTLYSIENVYGSDGDDTIDGDHTANVLHGGDDGDDLIRGHNGNDTVNGGDDHDTVWGDAGDDKVYGDSGRDEVRGGLGNDSLYGGTSNDHLRGEQDNDFIDGGSGEDTVFFWGEFDDFEVTQTANSTITVADLRSDGLEGTDVLTSVEFLEFFDGIVPVFDLFADAPVANSDAAETSAGQIITVDVLANDQSNSGQAWIASAEVVSGGGQAVIIGNRLIYDPTEDYASLKIGEQQEVVVNYQMETSGRQTSASTVSVTVAGAFENSPPDTTSTTGDFDGNGQDDILVLNQSSGTLGAYEMSGDNLSWDPLTTLPSGWEIQATGDFDGNGQDDILVLNQSSGALGAYEMSGDNLSWDPLTTLPSEWEIQAIGDFDGNGQDDILVFNQSSGALGAYEMSGDNLSWDPLTTLPAGWDIQAIGDFDGNGQDDILVFNQSSGALGAYEMSGDNLSWDRFTTLPSGWDVQATGDFDGNGQDDILVLNQSSGALGAYEMSGDNLSWDRFTTLPSGWDVQATGDFDGNGQDDILVFNQSSGALGAYEMFGDNLGWDPLTTLPTDWDIA